MENTDEKLSGKLLETYKELLNSKDESERGLGVFLSGLLVLLHDGVVDKDNLETYYKVAKEKFSHPLIDLHFAELDINYFHVFGEHI